MLPIPSCLDFAKKLIKNNPDLFHDTHATRMAIAKVLDEYHNACVYWQKNVDVDEMMEEFEQKQKVNPVFEPDNLFEQMAKITKDHAKYVLGIDIDAKNDKPCL